MSGGDTSDFWEAVDDVADFVHEWADGCRNGDRARDAIATLRDERWRVIDRNGEPQETPDEREAAIVRRLAGEWGEMEVGPCESVDQCVDIIRDTGRTFLAYLGRLADWRRLARDATGLDSYNDERLMAAVRESLRPVVGREGGEGAVPAPAVPMEGEPGPLVLPGAARASMEERKRMLEQEAAALLRALSHSREVSMSMAALREVHDWADRWDEAAQPIDSAQDLANDPVVDGGER